MANMKLLIVLAAAFLFVNCIKAEEKEEKSDPMTITRKVYYSKPVVTHQVVTHHQVIHGGSTQVIHGGTVTHHVSGGSSHHVVKPKPKPKPAGPSVTVINVWFRKFVGWWTIMFGNFRLIFSAGGGFITINGHRIRLVISNRAQFPAMSGWFYFTYGGYLYFINIIRFQVYRFSVNGSCRSNFKGLPRYCGIGRVVRGQQRPAPARPSGGCYVDFYQHINYGGVRNRYSGAVRLVSRNDDMSSLKVPRGCCATIYEHGNWQGRSQRYCSRDVRFVGGWWNDKVSSVRVSGNLAGGHSGGSCRAEIFQHANFGGVREFYSGDVRQVRRNDDMSSLKVGGGCCVIIYEHGNFGGRSQRYCSPVKFVGGWWNDKMSSLKVVRGDEPEEELDEEEEEVEDEKEEEK